MNYLLVDMSLLKTNKKHSLYGLFTCSHFRYSPPPFFFFTNCLSGLFPCPHFNFLSTPCLDYLLVHILYFFFFYQHLWNICMSTCLLLFVFTNSLFGLFTCSHVRYLCFFLTNNLFRLFACLHAFYYLFFYQQFVSITCLFTCPLIFSLPTPRWDYWLVRMSFTIIIAYQGLVYL